MAARSPQIDLVALQRQITEQLKPKYSALQQSNINSEDAYTRSYDQAVALISKATHVSQSKTRFEERALLQDIMNEVSR